MATQNLDQAKRNKCDEFYTRYDTIEQEMQHFSNDFNDKVICCPCDDYTRSNFYKYFFNNFKRLKLKKLITSCYYPYTYALFAQNRSPRANYTITELIDGQVVTTPYMHECDGDFRSEQVRNLIKQSDIVVTNPPFSLMRDFISAVRHKQFIILANMNIITFNNIFPLFMSNKIFIGVNHRSGDIPFEIPDNYANRSDSERLIDGVKVVRFSSINWYNNIRFTPTEPLILTKHYTPEEYPKYDNCDAILINKTCDIPKDYEGAMAVPITFLEKWNPDQFSLNGMVSKDGTVKGKLPYVRLLIKNKHPVEQPQVAQVER